MVCSRSRRFFDGVLGCAIHHRNNAPEAQHTREVNTYGQPAALAVVFAGYVIGWWKELAGGALAIVGTFAFFALLAAKSKTPPEPAAVWFAAPGILYLLAFQYNERRNKRLARQS